jgi:hypothetical protein
MRSPSVGLFRDAAGDGGETDGRDTDIRPRADFTILRRDVRGRRAPGNKEVMSMERLRRVLAGGTLAVMLGAVAVSSGCKSTQNPVPPGPKYSTMGGEPSSSGFNSDPHPYNAMTSPYGNNPAMGGGGQPGMPGMPGAPGLGGGSTPGSPADGMPPGLGAGGGPSSYGTPAPGSPGMGQPTGNLYGPPGTAGVGR